MSQNDPTQSQNQDAEHTQAAGGGTTRQRRPRELPRRGYDNQARPMAPPPPSPLTTERSQPRVSRVSDQSRQKASPPPPAASYPEQAAAPPRPRYRRPSKATSGLYLPWWSLLILIIVAGVASFGLLAFVMSLGGDPIGDQPAQIVIVTNANEPTPFQSVNTSGTVVSPGSISTNLPSTPTPLVTATNVPASNTECPFGQLVEVQGVGEAGLSIRSEPRQAENIQAVAYETENFRIISGPVETNGIIWCQVEGVDFPTADRTGWAARSFLIDIEIDGE